MSRDILEIEEGSPLDYEELVVYIMAREKSLVELVKKNMEHPPDKPYIECGTDLEIALLHQEEGPDKVKIKFLEGIQEQEYAFDDLIQVLQKAKEALLS
jgi:hypothetical protein